MANTHNVDDNHRCRCLKQLSIGNNRPSYKYVVEYSKYAKVLDYHIATGER